MVRGLYGNYVAAVWYGNDDHTSTNKLTGGSLPAQTWHDVMEPAHKGIELKPMPGLKEGPRAAQAQAAPVAPTDPNASAYGKLSRRSFEVIGGLNGLFRSVERASNATDAKGDIKGNAEPRRAGERAGPGGRASARADGPPREVAEGVQPAGGRIGVP